jgi:rhamnogalacturonan acetylesterase
MVMDQLQPGDWVIVQFGHNDAANLPPTATTLKGDETQEIESPITHKPKTLHSCGWNLRQYVSDANKGIIPLRGILHKLCDLDLID